MTALAELEQACRDRAPSSAVVLGSGLGSAAGDFVPEVSVEYRDIPGFAAPTVAGHGGRLALGDWAGCRTLVCFGRIHFYEGHPWPQVTRLVELVADLGAGTLVLTNAAGGIHPDLEPGDLMAVRGHRPLLAPDDWRAGRVVTGPYCPALLARAERLGLPTGVYAAVTGPNYETPAEVRMLKVLGCDCVGMSTAREAETAHARGVAVVAVSCVTNNAAGLVPGKLTHAEVEATAKLAVGRLGWVLRQLLGAP